MDAEEGDDEPSEQRHRISAIRSVESLEQNEGCHDRCRGKAHIVHRVYARGLRVRVVEGEELEGRTHSWRTCRGPC